MVPIRGGAPQAAIPNPENHTHLALIPKRRLEERRPCLSVRISLLLLEKPCEREALELKQLVQFGGTEQAVVNARFE